MNNILEEITYSDGRMDDVVKSLYTPAKLKLRARTYEGINRNLSKRRGATTSNAFSIPNAFMAVEVPSGNEGGSGYTVIASDNLEEIKASEIQSKKLKINAGQASGITSKAISVPIEEKEQHQVEETPVTEVSVKEVETPVIAESETHEVPNVVVTNEVEPQEAVQVSEPEVAVTQTPTVDPLDVAREKVLNTPPVTPIVPEDANKDVAEEVEETDVFKDLEKVTNEYAKVDEEFKKSAQALEEAQKNLETSITDFEKIEDNIERTNTKIRERNESIDSAMKEKEDIENQIKEIEEKTRAKIRLVNSAKEQRLREKRAKEEETSKILSENKSYQEKIEESTKKANELEQQDKELEQKENEALDAKREAQDRYNSKLAVFEAITLPEGINLENDMEEVASISKFPTFIDSENNYYNDMEQGYSYKKVA